MTELQKMLNTTETFMYGEFKVKVADFKVCAVEYPTDIHEVQFEDLDGDVLYEYLERMIQHECMSLFRVLEIKDGWYTIAAIIWTDDPSAWVYYASGKALGWLECEPEFDEMVIYV